MLYSKLKCLASHDATSFDTVDSIGHARASRDGTLPLDAPRPSPSTVLVVCEAAILPCMKGLGAVAMALLEGWGRLC